MFIYWKNTFRDRKGSFIRENKSTFHLSFTHKSDRFFSLYVLHKIDSVSQLLAFPVTEEKHSDPCSAESGERITYGGGKVSDRKYCFR